MEFTNGFSAKTDKAYKNSSNLISETMLNIRTVNSFGYEDMIQKRYSFAYLRSQEVCESMGQRSIPMPYRGLWSVAVDF